MGHSELSPSDSARWSRCPGSINFTRPLRDEDDSKEYSAEGTVAHTIREECLTLGFNAYDFIGLTFTEDGFSFLVDEEMADNIQPGVDEIREYEGELFVEKWVNTTKWLGKDSQGRDQGGSMDAGVAGEKLIVISDLKFGKGVAVQAVDNTQQVLYALAFWEQYARHITDATEFLIIIDQPRNRDGGGRWRVSLDALLAKGEELRLAAERTRDPGAPLIATDYGCQWCPAANMPGRKGGCPTHHEWIASTIDMKFDDIEAMNSVGIDWNPPQVLSREVRSHIVRMKSTIEKWLEKLHADELEDLINYGPACGFKAVEGRRGNRKHRDEIRSQAWMKARAVAMGKSADDIFTKKLISPAQGEKLLRLGDGKFPKSLIEQGAPKPVMVPVEDDRPSIATVDDKFEEV